MKKTVGVSDEILVVGVPGRGLRTSASRGARPGLVCRGGGNGLANFDGKKCVVELRA